MVYGHIAMPAAPASLAHFFNEHQFHHDTMGHDADEHEHDEGVSQSQLSNPLVSTSCSILLSEVYKKKYAMCLKHTNIS